MMRDMVKHLRAALPDAIRRTRKRMRRIAVRSWLDITRADNDKRLRAERHFREREQYHLLRQSDAVVVSDSKSGRTWLRVMISRLYQQIYGLPADTVIEFDNFHHMDRRIPKLFFTHDTHIREFTGHLDSKVDYYDKKVLLLVRDPRDVVVSKFFHSRYRSKPWKGLKSTTAVEKSNDDLFDFVLHSPGGLPMAIDFINKWMAEIVNARAHDVIQYENLRADPHATLARITRFLTIPASDKHIAEAVEYASYDNMKNMESNQSFRSAGARITPRDASNPDSYKVRRAKVGGYRDYFTDAQIEEIDAFVANRLNPMLRHNGPEQDAQ